LLLAAVLIPAFAGVSGAQDDSEPLGLFLKAMGEIQERYVDEGKVATGRLLEKAEEGVVGSLDPESMILPETGPSGTAEIGLTVGLRDGGAWVLDVVEGSPAERSGLKIGDQLLRIEGENAGSRKRPEIDHLLKGLPGSAVTLMWADRDREYFEAQVKREPVIRPSLRRFSVDGTGVIQVFRLDAPAVQDLKRMLAEEDGAVLDLRRAAIGDPDAALDLAGSCFAGGELLAIGTGADPVKARQYVAEKKKTPVKTRLVILSGWGTCGAPEMLVSALKEHHRAVVVGAKTFGSVSRQKDFKLNGRTVRLTVERFRSAANVSLSVTGVGADLPVEEKIESETVRFLGRRGFPERMAERLLANPPSAFDLDALKAGELKLGRVATKDKSVAEQKYEFEQSFVVAADSLLRDLDLDIKSEEVDLERSWLISQTRKVLARKLMKPESALVAVAREDPEIVLAADVLKALPKLEVRYEEK
jgi:carboxyl-terminal processing protease